MSILTGIRKFVLSAEILTTLMANAHFIVYVCLLIHFIDIFVYIPIGIVILLHLFFWFSIFLLLGRGDLKTLTIAFSLSSGIFLITVIYIGARYHFFAGSPFVYMIFAGAIALYARSQMIKWEDGQVIFDDISLSENVNNSSNNYAAENRNPKSDLKFCPYCGNGFNSSPAGLKFCPTCGKDLSTAIKQSSSNDKAESISQPKKQALNPYADYSTPSVSGAKYQTGNQNPVIVQAKENTPSPEYVRGLIAEAEKTKSSASKSIAGGVIMIIIWMICFFTPAIWTNLIFFIIIGPIMIVVGSIMISSANNEIAELNRKLR